MTGTTEQWMMWIQRLGLTAPHMPPANQTWSVWRLSDISKDVICSETLNASIHIILSRHPIRRCPQLCLSVCISLYVCLPICSYLRVCLYMPPSLCLISLCMSVCVSTCVFLYLYLYVCLSVSVLYTLACFSKTFHWREDRLSGNYITIIYCPF